MKKKIAAAAAAAAAMLTLSSCSQHYTDPSMVALRYSGGLGEGGKFKECVEPGDKQISDDTYYPYPTSQRQNLWDSSNEEADHKDLAVIDRDGNIAYLRLNVTFTLNTECETLRTFHDKIGRTRKAYFNDDGTYGSGWSTAMNYYVSPPVVKLAKAAAVNHTVEEMWLQPDVQAKISTAIETGLQDAVNATTEGEEQFYENFAVTIMGITPDSDFTGLYKERKAAQVRAETAEANRLAQVAEARAQADVAAAQARIKRAEIAAYPSVEAYLKAQLIEQGGNPFQPTGGLISGQ